MRLSLKRELPALAAPGAPRPIRWLCALLGVVAAGWILLALSTFGRAGAPGANLAALDAVLGGLMLANAALLLVIAYGIGRRRRWPFYAGVGVLLVNAVLSVTDEFGLLDFLFLLLNLVLLALLVWNRGYLLNARE